jgi:hypothetical protein
MTPKMAESLAYEIIANWNTRGIGNTAAQVDGLARKVDCIYVVRNGQAVSRKGRFAVAALPMDYSRLLSGHHRGRGLPMVVDHSLMAEIVETLLDEITVLRKDGYVRSQRQSRRR